MDTQAICRASIATERTAATAGQRQIWLFILAYVALVVVIVFNQAHIPLVDYSNHYARVYLLGGAIEQPDLAVFYQESWSGLLTNILIDIVAKVLGGLVAVDVLMPALLVVAIVLPVIGAITLNRALHGGLHWSHLFFLLFAFNQTLVFGFLNFQIGLGLAMLFAAAETRLVNTRLATAIAVRLLFAVILLVAHVFAVCFYAVLLAGLAFGPGANQWRAPRALIGALVAAVGRAVPALVCLVGWWSLSTNLPGAHVDVGGPTMGFDFSLKSLVGRLLSPVLTYDFVVDGLVLIVAVTMVAALVVTGRLRIHAGLALVACSLLALALVVPPVLAGTHVIDRRLPIMAVLTGLAALRPDLSFDQRVRAWAFPLGLFLFVAWRALWVGDVWAGAQPDYHAVQRALAQAPQGSIILPMEGGASASALPFQDGSRLDASGDTPTGRFSAGGGMRMYGHYGSLAVVDRQAFVPNLFAALGKQPISVRTPWKEISVPEGRMPLITELDAPHKLRGYVRAWRDRFDFVLVLNADWTEVPSVVDDKPELQLVADEGFARLYRVRREP